MYFSGRKNGFILEKKCGTQPEKTTKETRLRVLKWKIFHDIYPTNIMLNRMNIRESDKCTFCPDICLQTEGYVNYTLGYV